MVYDGKSIDMDDLGVTPPFYEAPILCIFIRRNNNKNSK
jgi:hypothetical protein